MGFATETTVEERIGDSLGSRVRTYAGMSSRDINYTSSITPYLGQLHEGL